MSLLLETTGSVSVAINQSTAALSGSGRISGAAYVPVPRYVAGGTITILPSDYYVVSTNTSQDVYVELPDAASNVGRVLVLRNNAAFVLYSSESNVKQPPCGAGPLISNGLSLDYPQAWVEIQSDGTYWVILRGLWQGGGDCD